MEISRATLVKTAPRLASLAPFWRLIVDHLECPDIVSGFYMMARNVPDAVRRSRRPARGPLPAGHPGGAAVQHDELPRLRNVVLAGHAGSGKTTLAEHLLFVAGAIARLGRVDDGTASLDFEPEEQKRKLSLSLAVNTLRHDDHRITLLDTPGYADFVGEVIEGFAAADSAIIAMDASGGVEAGTETAIRLGRHDGACRHLRAHQVRSRERGPAAGARRAARTVRQQDRAAARAHRRPADGFRGYVDVVHRRAYLFEKGQPTEVPIPAELADEVATRRDQLLEAAAEADDDVMTKFLEGEDVSDAELDACLHRGVRDRILAPVLLTAAAREIGIAGLLDAIVRYLPTPDEEPPVKVTDAAGAQAEVPPDPDGPLVLQVFKTTADPFVGRLSYFRVWSGTIRAHDHVWNAARGEEERIGQVLVLKGKEQEAAGEIQAGEIGAVAKLTVTRHRRHPLVARAAVHHGARSSSPSRACRWPSSPPPRPTWTS